MTIGDNKGVPPQIFPLTYIEYWLGTQIGDSSTKLAKKVSMLNTCQEILAIGSAAISLVVSLAEGAASSFANQAGQMVASNLLKVLKFTEELDSNSLTLWISTLCSGSHDGTVGNAIWSDSRIFNTVLQDCQA